MVARLLRRRRNSSRIEPEGIDTRIAVRIHRAFWMMSESDDEDAVGFVGKLANTFQTPSYHTSNVIRRLQHRNHSIRPRDENILNFYGELESMRLRNAIDSRIPSKKSLFELSVHELWGSGHRSLGTRSSSNSYHPDTPSQAFSTGRSLGPNVLASSVDAVSTESLYMLALKVLSIQPRVAHFMMCSAKSNVLQDYCWPVCHLHDEASVMKDLRCKRDYFRNTFDVDRLGDSSVDRFLMLSNEVKLFCPKVTGNQLVWGENFHIVSRHRAFERNMRQPPTVLVEMARKGIHQTVRNDQFLTIPSLSSSSQAVADGHSIVQDSINSIKLEDISTRPVPGIKTADSSQLLANRISSERQLGVNSFARNPTVKKSIQEQSFELAIARYFEATLDALLEAIFQFVVPVLRIAADDVQPLTTIIDTSGKNSRSETPVGDKALLQFVSQSTAIAMDAVRFHGIPAYNQKPDVKLKSEYGILYDSLKPLKLNKSQKRKLYVSSRLQRFPDSEEFRENIRKHEESIDFKESNGKYLSKSLKRRRLQVGIELPEVDRAGFQARVSSWKRPKTIQELRSHLARLRANKTNISISGDESTIRDDDRKEEALSNSRKRKFIHQLQNFSKPQKKREILFSESREGNEKDEGQKEENEDEHDTLSLNHLNSKKRLAESIPLPVPLSRVYYPSVWRFRKDLGSQLLRWQKGGVFGSSQIHRLQIRRQKGNNRIRRNDSNLSENFDDSSVISAITGDDLDVLDRDISRSMEESIVDGAQLLSESDVIKIVAAAPSVAGTLETHYRYREQGVNAKTGSFDITEPSLVTQNDEKQEINWEHILTSLQLLRDICGSTEENLKGAEGTCVRIHPDLPAIPVDKYTLKRIQYRLVSIFTNFLRENEPQHYPLAVPDGEITVHDDLFSSIASVPRVLRSNSYFPKARTEVTASSLPPSFLLTNSVVDCQNLTNILRNMDSSAGNENNSSRKRVRFFNKIGYHTEDSKIQTNILEKAAIQSIFGYGAFDDLDVSRTHALDESSRFGGIDAGNSIEPVDSLASSTNLRRNNHFFPRPVMMAAKKISVRYQYHLKRLRRKYPSLHSQLLNIEKKENPYWYHSDSDDAAENSASSDHIPASRKQSPFPLLSSPMKLRNSLSMSTIVSFGDVQPSISPSQSVVGNLHEYDSYPLPFAYPLTSQKEDVQVSSQPHNPPVHVEIGVPRRVKTRQRQNASSIIRSQQQQPEKEPAKDSFDFFSGIDSAEL